jgi:hypothetical protein
VPFIRAADDAAPLKASGNSTVTTADGTTRTALVEEHKPEVLVKRLALDLSEDGKGREGLLDLVQKVLQYSVNTWDQGFMDKLYASNNAVRLLLTPYSEGGWLPRPSC